MRIRARSGNAKLLSRAPTVKQKKQELSPASEPYGKRKRHASLLFSSSPNQQPEKSCRSDSNQVFTLQLVRPARTDGRSGLQWQQSFDPSREKAAEDSLLVQLVPSEPYHASLNGQEILSREGHGWGKARRDVLTIYAVASKEMRGRIRHLQPGNITRQVTDLLAVPILAREPFKVLLNGRLVVEHMGG